MSDEDWKAKEVDNVEILKANNGWFIQFFYTDDDLPTERFFCNKLKEIINLMKEHMSG